MASLSNINGIFDVHSTGAIQFNGNHGTAGQILKSNGNAAPTWVDASTVIGGPYLPLTGGTLTGATATASGISFTVGGNLSVTGTSTLTGALGLPGTAAQYVTGTGALATFPAIPQGDITAVIAGTDLSGGGTSGSVTLNNTSTLATITGRGASTGTSTTFGSTGVNTKLRVVDTTYYTSPTYSWTNSAIQTTSMEIVDATTDNANVCATLVMHNYGDGGVKFRMGNTGDKTLYLSSGQSAGAGNPTDDNSGTYFDEMRINNAVVYHTGNLPSGSGVTSVATGTGLTGGTITTTGTLSIDSTVATLAGQQVFTGNKYFNNFFLEYNSKTLANFNDLNNTQFEVSMYNVYSLATASTGMLSTYGTLFEVNGQISHDKTQFAFNGGNGHIQYRKSWYPNTAWTSFRQIWDSGNLPNPTQGGPYLPLTGGNVTGLTNFTKANGPVVQITKTGSAPGNNTTLIVENTYANHSWGIVQEIRGGGTTGTDRPGLLFSSPLTSQTWTTGYYQTSDTFAITSNRGYRNGGWGSWRMQVDSSGNTFAAGSSRAPIFYDTDNTAYYGDFAGSSQFNVITTNGNVFNGNTTVSSNNYITFGPNTTWGSSLRVGGNGRTATGTEMASIVTTDGNLHLDAANSNNAIYLNYYAGTGGTFFGTGAGGYVARVYSSGNAHFPIYYDYSNTAYYVDPASTSNMNALQFNYTQHGSANNIRMGNSTTMNAISSGTNNAAFGVEALGGCSTGSRNFAYGYAALYSLSSGGSNIAMGDATGYNVTSGSNNLLFGQNAGRTGFQSPYQSIAGITSGSNQIHMGNESHTTARIQISWTVNSDARDKTDVNPLDLGLEFVKQLNPVTYRWDKRSDYEDRTPDGTNKLPELTLGFLAQEVEVIEKSFGYDVADKTNLVVDRIVDQDHYGITYEKMVPILTKAIQELEARVKELENN